MIGLNSSLTATGTGAKPWTKMSRALDEYMITGIKTTISFQQAILQDPNFRRGVYSTNFIEQLLSGARRELIEEKA